MTKRDNKNNHQSHNNPYNILPPANLLEEYEAVSGGSVKSLLEMARREQSHRQAWQDQHLKIHARIYKWGQIFAFLYNVILLGLVGYLIDIGNQDLAVKLFTINACVISFAILVTFAERRIMNRRPPRNFPKKHQYRDNKNKPNHKRPNNNKR